MAAKQTHETNPESFAPNWRVDSIKGSIDDLKTSIKEDSQETKKLLNDFIKEARDKFVTKEELAASNRLIDEKYAPTKKAVWGIGATVVGILISYAFQLFINLQGVGK